MKLEVFSAFVKADDSEAEVEAAVESINSGIDKCYSLQKYEGV